MPGFRLESPSVDRRGFLALAAGATAVTLTGTQLLSALTEQAAANPLDPSPFTLGVASGDPHHDSVVLWTRLAPEPLTPTGGMDEAPVEVLWEIARDEQFREGYQSGTVTALSEDGHSVHVEATELRPDAHHWYRFTATVDGAEVTSRTGRTRTLPAPGHRPESLSFAFASCQAWVGGAYPAWRDLAEQDLDFVIHLGDYIYETQLGTLEEFRRLHALYKTSPDLREAHARFPFVTTWDDHEVQNNYAADEPGAAGDGTPFLVRRAHAYKAYFEHLPLRAASEPEGPDMLLYRRFGFGRLAEFSVLDTRQYRDDQAQGDGRKPVGEESLDPSRTMTGPEQERWLLEGLSASKAQWNVIPQQTIMARFDYDLGPDLVVNLDQWDGYPAARSRILDHLVAEQVSNPIVLSGDWHTAWVNDLLADFDDPGSDVIATEFVGTSISSGAGWDMDVRMGLTANPHVRFYNGTYRGYVRCDVTAESWRSTYRVVLNARDAASQVFTMGVWEVADGTPGAHLVDPGEGLGGIVSDDASAPISMAEVRVLDADGTEVVSTLTDPQGRYQVFLPAGTYTVQALAVGFETGQTTVPADGGGEAGPIALAAITGVQAGTGRLVPGPRREATEDDIVLENGRIALAISAGTQDPQMRLATVGKPLDLAARGHLDQLDWLNLPYAAASQPTGTGAWQSRTVLVDQVEAVDSGSDEGLVRAIGAVVGAEHVTVTTEYRLAPDSTDIRVSSTFTNTGDAPVTLWIGDAMDHDGAGQRSGVAGTGTVSTPYGAPAAFAPEGRWIGMTGTDGQVYGLLYEDDAWDAYGNGNWIMSRREVQIPAGGDVVLERVLTARTISGELWDVLGA